MQLDVDGKERSQVPTEYKNHHALRTCLES